MQSWSRTAAVMLALMMAPVAAGDWASFHGDARNSGHVEGSDYQVYEDLWWNNKTEKNAQIVASPVLKDGRLIVADTNGLVRALDAQSGGELWRYSAGASVLSTPAIEGERVYLANNAGSLVALNLLDGRVEATASVGKTEGGITVYGGNVFIGNEGGIVHAYDSGLTLNWKFSVATVRSNAYLNDAGTWTCSGAAHAAKPIRGAPMVFDGKVFFGSLNHHVYAVDLIGNGDGSTDIQWIAELDGAVYGSPALSPHSRQDYMVVGTDAGIMYRFTPSLYNEGANPCHGTKHPRSSVYNIQQQDPDIPDDQPVAIRSSPATAGDLVYFGANNGHMYALDARNMGRVWEQKDVGDTLNKITSSPAVANGVVVVGSEDNNVYWLSAANGSILKEFGTGSAIETSPAIDGDRAYVAAKAGTVYMFGPKLPPRPDLVVSTIGGDAEALEITIKNEGKGDAKSNGTVRVFLAGNLLVDLPFKPLDAGAEATLVHQHEIKDHVLELRAVVDWSNKVVEEDEANNDLARTLELPREEPEESEPPVQEPDVVVDNARTPEDEGVPGPAMALLLAGLAVVALRRRG